MVIKDKMDQMFEKHLKEAGEKQKNIENLLLEDTRDWKNLFQLQREVTKDFEYVNTILMGILAGVGMGAENLKNTLDSLKEELED